MPGAGKVPALGHNRALRRDAQSSDTQSSHTGETPMAAYLIANLNIFDPKTYDTYRAQVKPLVEKFGGRFLVRGGKHESLEGTWVPTRLVVLEFPDMAALKRWYASPDYTALIELRQSAAYCDVVTVEGV
jgi:uncharacterized protein (DUF1330 family)